MRQREQLPNKLVLARKQFRDDRSANFALRRGEHATAKEVGDRVVNFTTLKGKGCKFFILFLAQVPQRGQLTPKEKNGLNLSPFSGRDATARVNGENFSPFSGVDLQVCHGCFACK